MSDTTQETLNMVRTEDRTDKIMTVASGWFAIICTVLGIHRWMAVGSMDWWARAGLIFGAGLALMWVWGFWPQITEWLRGWRRGGGLNSALIAIGLIGCLIIVNALVRRRVEMKLDLTKNQRFTLSPQTRSILKTLKEPVKATVYLPAGRQSADGRDLFRQYADTGDKFTWTQVDPLVNPEQILAKNVRLSPQLSGARLEYGGKTQDITEFTEKEVTGAVLKLTRPSQRKILFLTGHGEPDVSATATAQDPAKSIQELLGNLRNVNWPVETVDLLGKNAAAPDPAEVAALVIAGPERELAADEQKRVNEYLNKGGHVLLMLNPRGPSFAGFLAPWGIKTGNDLVVNQARGILAAEPSSSAHLAVRAAQRVLFLSARSVTPATPAPNGITVTELMSSGPGSEIIPNFEVGKTDLRAALRTTRPGPVSIAAMAEKSIGSGADAPKARLAVVGDNLFIADQIVRQVPNGFNMALGSGLINYLGEEEALVSIPPKDENTEQAFVDEGQQRLLWLIHMADFPLLALLLAVIVYVKRR